MKINELSKKTNTPISTIRYYEKIELIPVPFKHENGYRDYNEIFIDYLNVIKYLSALEFKLSEIKNMFLNAENQTLSIDYINTMIETHESNIKNRLNELKKLSNFFKKISKDPETINQFIELVNSIYNKNKGTF